MSVPERHHVEAEAIEEAVDHGPRVTPEAGTQDQSQLGEGRGADACAASGELLEQQLVSGLAQDDRDDSGGVDDHEPSGP